MLNKKIAPTFIGGDGEFLIINPENNKLEIAANWVNVDAKHFSRDAYDKIFEIKPDYSECPLEVVASIKKILHDGRDNFEGLAKYKWVAGTFIKNCPLGFHIHFSYDRELIPPLNTAVFWDNYFAPISLILENRQHGLKRRAYNRKGYSYGKMSDIRIKDSNKKIYHAEYRACSSFLGDPYITCAMLCLAKVVIDTAINDREFKLQNFVEKNDFINMNQDKLKKQFPFIWKEITSMRLYPKYKPYLNIIPFLVKNNLTWQTKHSDMKEAWNIS